MTKEGWIQAVGMIAAIVLPFWNIPLILKIIKRKSSSDISLLWALGVWFCLLFMFPSGLTSPDRIWRTFNCINLALFTCVVAAVLIYRKRI